jgi:putative Mg2+ transporter-C (MgtC) family protein
LIFIPPIHLLFYMVDFTFSYLEAELLAKVLFAGLLGLLVGVERQGGQKGAGMRTFCLICMGSALFTVLSVSGFSANNEPSRVAAQIVTGIGFIGAGVIWRQKDEEALRGITTAAAIWVASAIGVAVGLGFYVSSLTIAFFTMVILARGDVIKNAKENIRAEVKRHPLSE